MKMYSRIQSLCTFNLYTIRRKSKEIEWDVLVLSLLRLSLMQDYKYTKFGTIRVWNDIKRYASNFGVTLSCTLQEPC